MKTATQKIKWALYQALITLFAFGRTENYKGYLITYHYCFPLFPICDYEGVIRDSEGNVLARFKDLASLLVEDEAHRWVDSKLAEVN